ncbi:serine/threonine-protein kinase Nek8 isoform X3 [Cyanistes caeruleus]|uniref:serine/threonine-protein kinase Nek8 isoform X3 n=1 Tax=Cyanistes caeruleus TaxID=156563 RepID=UPI000CDA9EBB|nr:serine/threonine-protein kinase Nek8 isoform X3 [Cyanistes caeruleus]
MEKYERIRVVGRGAFGIVHLCLRKADQKLVILKQIPVEQMSKDERLAAQNECQVLKLLNHPNVIEYYENFLEDKALMIAMEYAPGGTLAEFIHKRCNSLLDEDTILHFFVQILLALHHVHTKQILHRDLKTQNILLDKHRMIVKIGDFGISKILSSKSKAYTVVGTPCYISPELCEGKPYNQKSDIWALGCVLYELASLKRAFEAANLPALVLKIMSGTFAPISDRYSPDLRQLILSMLNLDPSKRPQLNEIMAQAICIRPLLNLYTDVGSVKMRRPEKPLAPVPTVTHSRTGGRASSARPRGVRCGSAKTGIPPPLSSIYTWGSGITTPLRLPMLNTEVVQVSAGRTQKAGVTKSGRLILWEAPPMGAAGGPSLPGATEQLQPQFVSRFLEGQSGVTIKHVSCGDLFTACLTDRGIIMTFGSGSNGCLGHGNFTDVSQLLPRLPSDVAAADGFQPSPGTGAICHCDQLAHLFLLFPGQSCTLLMAGEGRPVGSSSQIPTNGAFHLRKIMSMRRGVRSNSRSQQGLGEMWRSWSPHSLMNLSLNSQLLCTRAFEPTHPAPSPCLLGAGARSQPLALPTWAGGQIPTLAEPLPSPVLDDAFFRPRDVCIIFCAACT